MTADARFWAAFTDWHVRTDHPWDYALHREAMQLNVEGFGRALGEALAPAVTKAAEAMRRFAESWPKS